MENSRYILYVEDEANLRDFTAESLAIRMRKHGYTVQDFRRIDQAKEFFKAEKDNIACIVTDLNMSDEWLGEYRSMTEGGMLSGWVWLQKYVYPEKPEMPTIIYSGYLSFLETTLGGNKQLSLLSEKTNIITVKKCNSEADGFTGLEKALKKLKIPL